MDLRLGAGRGETPRQDVVELLGVGLCDRSPAASTRSVARKLDVFLMSDGADPMGSSTLLRELLKRGIWDTKRKETSRLFPPCPKAAGVATYKIALARVDQPLEILDVPDFRPIRIFQNERHTRRDTSLDNFDGRPGGSVTDFDSLDVSRAVRARRSPRVCLISNNTSSVTRSREAGARSGQHEAMQSTIHNPLDNMSYVVEVCQIKFGALGKLPLLSTNTKPPQRARDAADSREQVANNLFDQLSTAFSNRPGAARQRLWRFESRAAKSALTRALFS